MIWIYLLIFLVINVLWTLLSKSDYVGKSAIIKKEFAFLESEYGFKIYTKQCEGVRLYRAWTNEKKNIIVSYDEDTGEEEGPIRIEIYDTYVPLGSSYDEGDVVFSEEIQLPLGSAKTRICHAAKWLKTSIENKTISIE